MKERCQVPFWWLRQTSSGALWVEFVACFVGGLDSACGVCAIALADQTVAQAKKKQANQLSSQLACLLN